MEKIALLVTEEQKETIYSLFEYYNWAVNLVDSDNEIAKVTTMSTQTGEIVHEDIEDGIEENQFLIEQDQECEECPLCFCKPCIANEKKTDKCGGKVNLNGDIKEIIVCKKRSKPDPQTDVRIDTIDDTAIISWMIPANQGVTWSRFYLNNPTDGDVYLDSGRQHQHKDIRFPHSGFEIANLSMCSEYYVRIQCIRGSGYSDCTTQTFWMTSEFICH
ncbi:unnamed protein product [Mytilus coruscus]|uniref:Fibronectin type-III domain-containing protein n=1 Tax=Mytilus coruscus TaxID=42192 RepID=A0A6J8BGJ8_MYTCO|nr:unnamed protein product [Mytilus coruscus]